MVLKDHPSSPSSPRLSVLLVFHCTMWIAQQIYKTVHLIYIYLFLTCEAWFPLCKKRNRYWHRCLMSSPTPQRRIFELGHQFRPRKSSLIFLIKAQVRTYLLIGKSGINLVNALPSYLFFFIWEPPHNLVHALPSLHALKLSWAIYFFFAVEYVANAIISYQLNVGVDQNRHNTSVYYAEHEF